MWIEVIRKRAQNKNKSLVLPEGHDKRIRQAAKIIEEKNIAKVTVLNKDEDRKNSTLSAIMEKGAKMVAEGMADGMVAGAVSATAEVIRTALKNIGTESKDTVVSSFFLMEGDRNDWGENGGFLFADCAVNPEPSANKLASIAYTTAHNARNILGWEPRVAFLSFSTKGSSKSKLIDKVNAAIEELKAKSPDFIFDGELQLDAAIIPKIANSKDPDGRLDGKANVLIFPDLNSANIGYKIAQRFGGMRAVGPILQGLKKPVNDLSRGSSIEDIVDVASITVLQMI
ncbi:phosphate acyltransferase [Elusimicrobiota bacterium]